MEQYRRGDIYYVQIPYAVGHELMKDRPAVIVSADALNFTLGVVSVVFLTGSREATMPYHVEVRGAMTLRHGAATALCDHVYTVDKSRIGKLMGTCTDAEMAAIDNGLLLGLALGDGKYRGPGKATPLPPPGAGVHRRSRSRRRRRGNKHGADSSADGARHLQEALRGLAGAAA